MKYNTHRRLIGMLILGVCLLTACSNNDPFHEEEDYEQTTIIPIRNNLRIIAATGLIYLLEEGGERITFEGLMHAGRLEGFAPVAGENYAVPTTTVNAAGGTLSVTLDNETIAHDYEGI